MTLADRVVILDRNNCLLEQNKEKLVGQSIRPIVVGNARIKTDNKKIEKQRKRDVKEVLQAFD